MIELFGDIWDHVDDYDVVVITTNGATKKNGDAVMGRGIALEAKDRYPWLPENLGLKIQREGNLPHIFGVDFNSETGKSLYLATLPVKPVVGPNGEPGWKAKANLNLIKISTAELVKLLDLTFYTIWRQTHNLPFFKAIMPRPGCGNGGLKWEDVKPVIEPYLDDRFTIMERA